MEQYLRDLVTDNFGEAEFDLAVEKLMASEDHIKKTASLAEDICKAAEDGNELALALLQEATQAAADYLIELTNKADYRGKSILLAGNGSLIKNDLYRKSLNDALYFEFPEISWVISKLSPAYGAVILAARLIDVDLNLEKISGQI